MIGQEVKLGVAVLVHSHVEYLKETVTMMMSVLAICYVEQTTASLHFHPMLTAAMTPILVVSKDLWAHNSSYISIRRVVEFHSISRNIQLILHPNEHTQRMF